MIAVEYLQRFEWGGTWDGTPPEENLPDGEVYVHHVGGAAWMGPNPQGRGYDHSRRAACKVFFDLNEYAKRPKNPNDGTPPPPGGWGKGYRFLDYDFLVWHDRFNDIVWIGEGRGEFLSAATRDRNEQGEAVCICGNLELRDIHPAEIEGAAQAIALGMNLGYNALNALILGHRDNPAHLNATQCPGRYGYAALDRIDDRVFEILNPPPVPEEDIMKIYLAFRKDDRTQLWRGDRCRSHQLDNGTRIGLMGRSFTDPRMNYFNPNTGLPLASWDEVPELTPNQIVADLGKPES